MKRIICLLLLFFTLCGCTGRVSNGIEICIEKSSMINFYEEDGTVHIICKITLYNTTDKNVTVRINGFSQEDVDTGLLSNPYLSGINAAEQSDLFLVLAGQYSEFLVDFCGKYGGGIQKQDRLVPDLIEIEEVG